MIFYLQFNAANVSGVIQVNDEKNNAVYYLTRFDRKLRNSYDLLGIGGDAIGSIKQTSTDSWTNYNITIGDNEVSKLIHITNTRKQFLIATNLHWIVTGDLVENNYRVHNIWHDLIMTVDNIYFKNGHEGYFINITNNVDPKIGILIAAVLNQTSRNTKNKRTLDRLNLKFQTDN